MASNILSTHTKVQNGSMNSEIKCENRVGWCRLRCQWAFSKFAYFRVLDICMSFTSVKSLFDFLWIGPGIFPPGRLLNSVKNCVGMKPRRRLELSPRGRLPFCLHYARCSSQRRLFKKKITAFFEPTSNIFPKKTATCVFFKAVSFPSFPAVDIFLDQLGSFGFVPKTGGFDQRCGTRSAGSESSPCLQFDLPRGGPRLMGVGWDELWNHETSSLKPAWDVDPINICLSRIRAARTWAPPWARWHAPSVARMMTRLGFSWVWSVVELVTVIPWEVGGLVQYLISKWMLELYANWI